MADYTEAGYLKAVNSSPAIIALQNFHKVVATTAANSPYLARSLGVL